MKTHNFHFLIGTDLKKKLNDLNELKKYSFSKKINFVLKNIDKLIKPINKLKINELSEVEYLESKNNIHAYIKEKLYKRIKKYHGIFNSYSIAIIVRLAIRLFLDMVEKHGYLGALKKIKKQKNKLKKISNIKTKKYKIVQLLSFLDIKQNKYLKLENILTYLLL